MKLIRYTLLPNGKIPQSIKDGGYFPVPNGTVGHERLDLIGLSLGFKGLQVFTTKAEFETYVYAYFPVENIINGMTVLTQPQIDSIWLESLV